MTRQEILQICLALKEWVIKDIAGVLLTMELERLVTVIGLAYQLPYVPDDNLRMESHVALCDGGQCIQLYDWDDE